MAQSAKSPTKREILSKIAEATKLSREMVASEDSSHGHVSFVLTTTQGTREIIARVVRPSIIVIILGLILGTVSYAGFIRFRPSYTAQATIEVVPPDSDPLDRSYSMYDNNRLNMFRMAKVAVIKSERFIREVIQLGDIRNTQWFQRFRNERGYDIITGEPVIAQAINDLKRNLNVVVPKDSSNVIVISMTCRGTSGKQESALVLKSILERMQAQLIENQTIKRDLTSREIEMTRYRQELQDQIDRIDNQLNKIQDSFQVGTDQSAIEKLKSKRDETRRELNAVNSSFSDLRAFLNRDVTGIRILGDCDFGEISSPIWYVHIVGWTLLLFLLWGGVAIFHKIRLHKVRLAGLKKIPALL